MAENGVDLYELSHTAEEIDNMLDGSIQVASWGTVLAEGVDLNTVLSPGVYAAPTNAIAAACSSLPDGYTSSGQAFKLIVEYTSTANFLRQTLIGRAGVLYARTYNVSSSTFGSWEKFITSTEFAALEERVSALEGASATAAVAAESEA